MGKHSSHTHHTLSTSHTQYITHSVPHTLSTSHTQFLTHSIPHTHTQTQARVTAARWDTKAGQGFGLVLVGVTDGAGVKNPQGPV